MSSPLLGRNARLYYNNVPIAFCKNISVKATAEVIKETSMDALTPAVIGAGKQTFNQSAERLFTDATYIELLLAGTKFDLVFHPDGTPENAALVETWTNCSILSSERTAGETGGLLEKISGEAEDVTLPN